MLSKIRQIHCWQRRTSTAWDYLPGPPSLWDNATVEQADISEAVLQQFDGANELMLRLLIGASKPSELIETEPWIQLMPLRLFE